MGLQLESIGIGIKLQTPCSVNGGENKACSDFVYRWFGLYRLIKAKVLYHSWLTYLCLIRKSFSEVLSTVHGEGQNCQKLPDLYFLHE